MSKKIQLNKIISLFSFLKKKKKEDKPEKKPSKVWYWIRKSVWSLFFTGAMTAFIVMMVFAWYAFIYLDDEFDLSAADAKLNYTSVVYAMKDGAYVEVETLHASENRIWADIDAIPERLQQAFIAIEDERFYQHSGVDIKRTLHAILNFVNPASSSSFGGSTITQQVIKNITGDDETTVSRKIQEIRRAWYVEREYKKDQILEVYLNTIYLSQGCYGVQTAAEKYFGKTLDELTILECASIASITKYPTKYDPIQNPENNLDRAHDVIFKMEELGFITPEEAEAAKSQTLKLSAGNQKETVTTAEINSYFVDQVVEDVLAALINEKGYSEAYARSLVFNGGIQIYSTMDMEVQKEIDDVYDDHSNFPSIKSGKDGSKPQSAIVIIDNETGAVVGMAGGVGEKKTARGLNRATGAYRQPGSSMKPIGTYAPAIEYGARINGIRVSPGLAVWDKGVRQQGGKWWPKNYGSTSEKYVTVQKGVMSSLNTIAVRVNNALGAWRAYDFLEKKLGITTLVPGSGNDANDQAMALGGLTKGISVMEITAAYAAFPNGGEYVKPYTFTKICDQNGRVILENKVERNTAMSENTAAIMNSMLHSAATAGTGSSANFGTTAVAGKTGTTSDDKDRWFVGYTHYYTAGVWFGYDIPATIYASGNPAARAWKAVMKDVHSGLSYKSFSRPSGLVSASACAETGKAPTEHCKEVISGLYFAGSVPTEPCDVCSTLVEGVPGAPGATVPGAGGIPGAGATTPGAGATTPGTGGTPGAGANSPGAEENIPGDGTFLPDEIPVSPDSGEATIPGAGETPTNDPDEEEPVPGVLAPGANILNSPTG